MKPLDPTTIDVRTSYTIVDELGGFGLERVAQGGGVKTPAAHILTDQGKLSAPDDTFTIYCLNPELEGPTILECSSIEPNIIGSSEQPDVRVAIEMLAFHVGENETIEEDTRATMRIIMNKDRFSTNRVMDTVYWSITAGLDLFDKKNNVRATSENLRGDFRGAFGNRPIEIPGSLGQLSFQVLKHKEPPWWRELFSFASSDTAGRLVSMIGLPGITADALKLFNQLVERLDPMDEEVLFESGAMRLAMSQWARDRFAGRNARVRTSCLPSGFCVLARGRDNQTIANSDAVYYSQYNRLAPKDVPISAVASGEYEDPFANVTYALFRVGIESTRLDPTFNFNS